MPVVERLIEQLPSLREYFQQVLPAKRPRELCTDRVIQIRAHLSTADVELDLLFLQAVLPMLNKFEKLLQQDSLMIHKYITKYAVA